MFLRGSIHMKIPWMWYVTNGPAYLTAVGTMSSAATLAVALQCAGKAKPLRKDMVQFGIPLFANIHLCGSVLTEVFFLYDDFQNPVRLSSLCWHHDPFLSSSGVFAIGAPGVPGGTVMASLGIITGVLGFNDTGTALMLQYLHFRTALEQPAM